MAGLLRTLRRDFEANSYFVTGVLDNAAIYSPDCLFADPTISFRGEMCAALPCLLFLHATASCPPSAASEHWLMIDNAMQACLATHLLP